MGPRDTIGNPTRPVQLLDKQSIFYYRLNDLPLVLRRLDVIQANRYFCLCFDFVRGLLRYLFQMLYSMHLVYWMVFVYMELFVIQLLVVSLCPSNVNKIM